MVIPLTTAHSGHTPGHNKLFMKSKKPLSFFLASLFVMGCSYQQVPENNLRIAIYDDPLTLFPYEARRALDLSIAKLLFEGLLRENKKKPGGVELALADSYVLSPDGTEVIFSLKKDAMWSDGTLLSAYDVIQAWEYTQETTLYTSLFSGLSFYAPDAQHVVLQMDVYQEDILLQLTSPAFFVFSPQNINKFSGPFSLESYSQGESLQLQKNFYYYDQEHVQIQTLSLSIIPDIHTATNLLHRGKMDWVGQPWHQGIPKELRKTAPYCSYTIEGAFWLLINTQHPVFQQQRGRELITAIHQIVNTEEILAYALQDDPTCYSAHKNSLSLKTDSSNLCLIYPINILRCQQVAEVLRTQFKAAGLDLHLEGSEYHVFIQKRHNQDFALATATGTAYYPGSALHPTFAAEEVEAIPLYQMTYDYLLGADIEEIVHNASGSVDLKYAKVLPKPR